MAWVKENGRMKFTATAKVVEIPDLTNETNEYKEACKRFREVCFAIGKLTGNPNFRGGFDETSVFQNSPEAASVEGISLALRWMAENECCTYLASKIGLGQPAWWYDCWEQYDLEQTAAAMESADTEAPLSELEL